MQLVGKGGFIPLLGKNEGGQPVILPSLDDIFANGETGDYWEGGSPVNYQDFAKTTLAASDGDPVRVITGLRSQGDKIDLVNFTGTFYQAGEYAAEGIVCPERYYCQFTTGNIFTFGNKLYDTGITVITAFKHSASLVQNYFGVTRTGADVNGNGQTGIHFNADGDDGTTGYYATSSYKGTNATRDVSQPGLTEGTINTYMSRGQEGADGIGQFYINGALTPELEINGGSTFWNGIALELDQDFAPLLDDKPRFLFGLVVNRRLTDLEVQAVYARIEELKTIAEGAPQ